MAGKEKGKETKPEEVEIPKVETLTPEEQMEAIKTQLTEAEERATTAEAKAEEKEKGFKSVQRQLSEQKLAPPKTSTSGTAQALQEVIGALEAQAAEVGELTPTTQAKLNAARQTLAIVERDAVFERQETVTSGVIADLRNKFEAIGEDPDDPKFDSIWDAVQIAKLSDGNFDRAKGRAERILRVVKPPEDKKPEEPKLTDEQKEKVARKWKEEHGELKTHEGIPSGTGGELTVEMVEKMSADEKFERRDEIAKISLLRKK